MNWLNVRRLFHFTGNLGGLRYEAKLGIFELNVANTNITGDEIANAPQKDLPAADEGDKTQMTEPRNRCE